VDSVGDVSIIYLLANAGENVKHALQKMGIAMVGYMWGSITSRDDHSRGLVLN
jgi:hypothetical protein